MVSADRWTLPPNPADCRDSHHDIHLMQNPNEVYHRLKTIASTLRVSTVDGWRPYQAAHLGMKWHLNSDKTCNWGGKWRDCHLKKPCFCEHRELRKIWQ